MNCVAKHQERASVQYLVQGCVKKALGVTFVHLVFARQSVKGRSEGRQDAKGSLAGGQNASLSLSLFGSFFSLWKHRAASFPSRPSRAN
jgi:hypothetical protein